MGRAVAKGSITHGASAASRLLLLHMQGKGRISEPGKSAYLCKDGIPQLVAEGGTCARCAIAQQHCCGQQLDHGHVGKHVPGGVRCQGVYGVLKQERHLQGHARLLSEIVAHA